MLLSLSVGGSKYMPSKSPSTLSNFSRDLSVRERPCIGIFGAEGSGKTRLAASAGLYAMEQGTTPGWIILDRKTRNTVKEVCAELGIDPPYMSNEFISKTEALRLATNDNVEAVKKIYTGVIDKVLESFVELAANPNIDPIVTDTGTRLWDWIAYSHFGRKQDVGKSRVWGPPKQDWTDLMDALSHKTVLITFWAKDEYKNDTRTGHLTWDGPPHLGFTTTSVVRMTQDSRRQLTDDETYIDRFSLDVVESQDNKGIEGVNGVLSGSAITYSNLMAMLRPEDE